TGEGNLQVFGDLEVGPAVAQAGEDFAADGGLAIEFAGAGADSLGDEVGGFGNFAAKEQAGGEMGDEVIPCAAADGGEKVNIMTVAAGEEWGWKVGEVRVAEFFVDDGIGEGIEERDAVAGVEDGADGKGIVNSSDGFF